MGSDHIGPPSCNRLSHCGQLSPTGGPTPGGYFLVLPCSIRLPTKKIKHRESFDIIRSAFTDRVVEKDLLERGFIRARAYRIR